MKWWSMHKWEVDLFSDTKTRPSEAMRAVMAAAEVGDEQQDEDPTVATLNERVAALLGKECAIFLPSGTMANVVATMVHCRRGDEILAEASSHVVHLETGGAAGISGATVTSVAGAHGIFSRDQLERNIRAPRRNAPRPRLVWIEQTTNLGGGRVWPLPALRAIRELADARGLAVHVDGARLMNAAVARGIEPGEYGAVADSIWIDFSKGLGAPFGAVLAGAVDFIVEARRYKHMLGGAMRQAGIMAAACSFALENNVERLAEDHAKAQILGAALRELPGLRVIGEVETNIVLLDVADTGLSASAVFERLRAVGVRVGVFGETSLRLVTHLDVSSAGIAKAIAAFKSLVPP
jgi:threonine aldolase